MIPVEKIKGKLLLIGASDDCLWDTVKHISRMEERLKDSRMDVTANWEAII